MTSGDPPASMTGMNRDDLERAIKTARRIPPRPPRGDGWLGTLGLIVFLLVLALVVIGPLIAR